MSAEANKLYRLRLMFGLIISVLAAVALYYAIPDTVQYRIHLIVAAGFALCCASCVIWAEKNKTIALMTALVPIVPLDYIYLDAFNLDDPVSIFLRTIPVVGNGMSLWKIFKSKTLAPAGGVWSTRLF